MGSWIRVCLVARLSEACYARWRLGVGHSPRRGVLSHASPRRVTRKKTRTAKNSPRRGALSHASLRRVTRKKTRTAKNSPRRGVLSHASPRRVTRKKTRTAKNSPRRGERLSPRRVVRKKTLVPEELASERRIVARLSEACYAKENLGTRRTRLGEASDFLRGVSPEKKTCVHEELASERRATFSEACCAKGNLGTAKNSPRRGERHRNPQDPYDRAGERLMRRERRRGISL